MAQLGMKPGTFVWSELATRDTKRAKTFYTEFLPQALLDVLEPALAQDRVNFHTAIKFWVDDIDGKLPGEERGIQDDAPKATTSVGKDAIGKKTKSSSRKKLEKVS